MCCKYCGHGSGVITPSSFVGLIDLYKMLGASSIPVPFCVLIGWIYIFVNISVLIPNAHCVSVR